MTEREKIIEAINSVQVYGITHNAFGGDLPVTNEMLADSLIAAGIGDVKEVKMVATRYEMLYNMQARDMVLTERKTYDAKHRAEVAERAFLILWKECKEKLGWNIDCTMWYAKQAEKELAEEGKK